MIQYDFEASVGYWITLTSHFYQQQLNEELAPYGITFRQFQVEPSDRDRPSRTKDFIALA